MAQRSLPPATVVFFITTFALATPCRLAAQEANQPAPSQQDPQHGTGQKVAEAEDPVKPTRSFFPALAHNLVDDVKHIPRRNSLNIKAVRGICFAITDSAKTKPLTLKKPRRIVARV